MIRFEHVKKVYGTKEVIHDLNITIPDGQFTVLIGPSGCGKTTTLKMINRLIDPDGGVITIDGVDIMKQDSVKLRRTIGYVIQQIGLFPNMTVAQNISVVPRLLKYDKERCDQIVHDMLDLVAMPYDEYAGKYPNELSGGQQQRVGVMRALAVSPPIVLMDEPFGALDPMTRAILQDEIKNLQRKLNKTVVFVTHDMEEALTLADQIIFMDKGEVVQMASPGEMLEHPASSLIQQFLGRFGQDETPKPHLAAEFMRSNVYKVYKDQGVHESIEAMARRGIDSLLVMNPDDTFAGTVSIRSIREEGRQHRTIAPLISDNNTVCYVDDDAQECFERLLDSDKNYVVVLNHNGTIAGIITKTSMARAMASALWSEGQGEAQ